MFSNFFSYSWSHFFNSIFKFHFFDIVSFGQSFHVLKFLFFFFPCFKCLTNFFFKLESPFSFLIVNLDESLFVPVLIVKGNPGSNFLEPLLENFFIHGPNLIISKVLDFLVSNFDVPVLFDGDNFIDPDLLLDKESLLFLLGLPKFIFLLDPEELLVPPILFILLQCCISVSGQHILRLFQLSPVLHNQSESLRVVVAIGSCNEIHCFLHNKLVVLLPVLFAEQSNCVVA